MIFWAVIYVCLFVTSVLLSVSARSAAARKDWPDAISLGLLSLIVSGLGFTLLVISCLDALHG